MNQPQISRREILALGCAAVLPVPPIQNLKPTIYGVSGSERDKIVKLGTEFLQKYSLPGVSLAMSYRGKLKLLACFGYADQENRKPVQPTHLFRVASVSKPITSVTILKLVERQTLTLDDKIFGAGGHLETLANAVAKIPERRRVEEITIRHLLEHSGGGWTNKRDERPMFAEPALGLSHPDLIRWTLANVPLKSDPGTQFAYSNFGYCLLGRVIEKVTGKPYEQAVQDLVLKATGAKNTHIGGHTLKQRRPNEVVYYDQYDPYGPNMDVSRMDAHGGWISTPTDLVRFTQRVDGFDSPPDILSTNSIKIMTTPTRGGYALGWRTNSSNNWWHTGSFNGGTSIMARASDGHCWAVTVNTRSYDKTYSAALDQFPWQVKAAVSKWGQHDLFRS